MVELVMATALAAVMGGVAALALQQIQRLMGGEAQPQPIRIQERDNNPRRSQRLR